ncbi:hypothetical protein Hamer_G027065 [Homarus americanus]|uniref:Uncharacterized protein n=1 Tax=Homarus americanus TaxID=6706 RepID=A0A8J5JYS9_HOMAM|nr:hypothetical protein Hamer_G027065 [Homarus americanus]
MAEDLRMVLESGEHFCPQKGYQGALALLSRRFGGERGYAEERITSLLGGRVMGVRKNSLSRPPKNKSSSRQAVGMAVTTDQRATVKTEDEEYKALPALH